MLCRSIPGLLQKRLLLPQNIVLAHTVTCPTQKRSVCPGSTLDSGSGRKNLLVRAERSGPVRFGFLPENWFLFFHPITGVSGPYVFGIVLCNYLLSKEIYVMEHEYYLGLSVAVVVYYVSTRFGRSIGDSLDAQIDAIQDEMEKSRQDEIDMYEATIEAAEQAKMRAQGQKLLMDAKKENIAMQLEAVYRERMMHVYRSTKGRMDYHAKKYRAEARIQQKWMLEWILENVRRSITPELEQQVLDAAIRDLAAAAGNA